MDNEQPENKGYAEVTVNEEDPLCLEDDAENNSSSNRSNNGSSIVTAIGNIDNDRTDRYDWWHKTMFSDKGISICGAPIVEGAGAVKLIKFILLTLGSIVLVHVIVAKITTDRDMTRKLWQMWMFESNLIVLDCIAFFVVGRLWRQRGVDHLAWVLPVVACNVFFESQHFFWWMQNSVSLYAMHCVWPWQLWVFVAVLLPTIGVVAVLHVKKALDKNLLLVKLVEVVLCVFFFFAPLVPSSYFHFHHWFAGFLLGMHCNFDVWWSRAAMAYCWGMYINGIGVYGRDPVLTCQYAYFLSIDQSCPYTQHPANATHPDEEIMVPVDWRNCSATTGYHP